MRWACRGLFQRLSHPTIWFIWEWETNKVHEETARGWEGKVSERYPLLSTASTLFLCSVIHVPLPFCATHYTL